MKKNFITTAALLIILLLAACTPNKKTEKETPFIPPSETTILPNPSVSPAVTEKPPESKTHEAALSVAELYRDIFISFYERNPAGVFLTNSETEAILARLGENGLAALDSEGLYSMKNPDLAESFVANNGGDARLTVYELCSDGGYICHDLSSSSGALWVEMSRVSWLDGGQFQMSGDIPTVTFSGKYQVTALEITPEGYLSYDYHMPDNPEGTNHDGHVETTVKLRLR